MKEHIVMIRRNSNSGNNYYDDYDHHNWDGHERRRIPPAYDYDGDERRNDLQHIIIEPKTIPETPKSSQSWMQANASLLSICLVIISSGGGFIFDLYNRVKDLEYKQSTIFEKIAENKQLAEEIKLLIKDGDKTRKQIEEQINSLEDTIMQMYRSSNKPK